MSTLSNNLSIAFNVRPGEGLPLILLLIHSFFKGISLVFLETTANTLFLKEFEAQTLPYVYIAIATLSVGLGLLYSRFESRFLPTVYLIATLVLLLLVLCIFYICLLFISPDWLVMATFAIALMIWKGVNWILLTIEFWALAGLLFNVRQGKRLFGLITSGDIIAGIIGGFSVPMLVKYIGTTNLLLISIVGIASCLAILIYTVRVLNHQFTISLEQQVEIERKSLTELFRTRYLILFSLISVLTSFSYYFVDFVFYDSVRTQHIYEEQIASFFGLFFATLGIVNLIGSTLLSGRLLTRYGLTFGLLCLPVFVTLGISTAVFSKFFADNVNTFFWIVVVTKLFDEMFRTFVESPTFRILYQPLLASERLRIQNIRESIIEPSAIGLSGLVLLLLTSVLTLKAIHLSYIMLILLIAWIVVAILLRHEYTTVLSTALTKRRLDGVSVSLEDKSSIIVLQKGLESPLPGEVIYCLNTLEEIEHNSLSGFLINLLEHSEPQVRKHVLSRIEHFGVTAALPKVNERILREQSSQVRGVALRTLCALAEADAFDLVAQYIDDSNPNIKKGAMVGLLRSGGIDGVLIVGERINKLMISKETSERKFTAEVLGEVGIASFYRPLLKLLQDEDVEVRRAALIASGKLKNLKLIPSILENLSLAGLREYAGNALIAFGELAIPALERAFIEESKMRQFKTRELHNRLIKICGHIGGNSAIAMLRKNMDFPIQEVRRQILDSLTLCGYQATQQYETTLVQSMIRNEVEAALWVLSAIEDIGEDETTTLLIHALKQEVKGNQQHIFSLLSFIHPSHSINLAKAYITNESGGKRAYALELLDNIVSKEIKNLIFPLFDDIPTSQRLSRLNILFPRQVLSRNKRLKAIIMRPQRLINSWTKACVLYIVGKHPMIEFYQAIIATFTATDALVRETAVWALGQLNPDDLVERLTPLKQDRSKRVRTLANLIIESVGIVKLTVKPKFLTRSGHYRTDFFANRLSDIEENRIRRCHAAYVLGTLQGEVAHGSLLQALYISDIAVHSAVLQALVKGHYPIPTEHRPHLHKLLETELFNIKRLLLNLYTFSTDLEFYSLIKALQSEMSKTYERVLAILSLLQDTSAYDTLHYWLIQSYQTVPSEVIGLLQGLLIHLNEDLSTRLSTSLAEYQEVKHGLKEWMLPDTPINVGNQVKELAFDSAHWLHAWTRVCALDMLVKMRLSGCAKQLLEMLTDVDDIVRETAVWALFKLEPETYRRQVRKLRNDSSPLVINVVQQLGRSPPISSLH